MSDSSPRPPSVPPDGDDPGDAVWDDAKRAFLAGASLPMVAERFGLHLRTVQRRAATHGWREALAAARPSLSDLLGTPDADAELARTPHLAPFAEAHAVEVGQLLMQTTPDLLARYALRKAGEAAASDQPTAAAAWVRVINGVLRAGPRLDRLRLPFSEADYMRAMYAAALRGEGAPQEGEPSGPGGAVVSPVVSRESRGGDTAGSDASPAAGPPQKSRSS